MVERDEISIHEARVFAVLETATGWLTNTEIAKAAEVAPRTARAHTLKFVKLGLVEVAEVFPAHRFRLRERAEKRNVSYYQRLKKAQAVFGAEGSK